MWWEEVEKLIESGANGAVTDMFTTLRNSGLITSEEALRRFEVYDQMAEAKQFLEWAKVYGNYYGVPKKEIKEALKRGQDVVVKVDVQGAATIKQILPDAVFVFLISPSTEDLANRLKQRQRQPPAELNLRLNKAQEEMESLSLFDYVVVNYTDKLDLAVSQINAIVTAEKCRVKPRVVRL